MLRTNILICGGIAHEADLIANVLPKDDSTVRTCITDEKVIIKELSGSELNSVLFFVNGSSGRWEKIIRNIRTAFPDIKIFAGASSASLSDMGRLRSAGADLCMMFPASIRVFTDIIHVYMRFCDDSRIPMYAACFLCQYGFSAKNTGFLYLCSAIDLCLKEPEYLEALYDRVYETIAERFGVQPELVERMLRRTASVSASNGTLSAVTGEIGQKITSHDLIAVLCDAYAISRYFII